MTTFTDYNQILEKLTDETNELVDEKKVSFVTKKRIYYISLPVVLFILLLIWKPRLITREVVDKNGKKVTEVNKLVLVSIVVILTGGIYYTLYKKGLVNFSW